MPKAYKTKPSTDRAAVKRILDLVYEMGGRPTRLNNGGERVIFPRDASKADVLKAMFQTDEDYLTVFRMELPEVGSSDSGAERFWMRFVYGNDPEEVLCDHSVPLDGVDGPMAAAIDKLTESWWNLA